MKAMWGIGVVLFSFQVDAQTDLRSVLSTRTKNSKNSWVISEAAGGGRAFTRENSATGSGKTINAFNGRLYVEHGRLGAVLGVEQQVPGRAEGSAYGMRNTLFDAGVQVADPLLPLYMSAGATQRDVRVLSRETYRVSNERRYGMFVSVGAQVPVNRFLQVYGEARLRRFGGEAVAGGRQVLLSAGLKIRLVQLCTGGAGNLVRGL
jgi:hypothetical protein